MCTSELISFACAVLIAVHGLTFLHGIGSALLGNWSMCCIISLLATLSSFFSGNFSSPFRFFFLCHFLSYSLNLSVCIAQAHARTRHIVCDTEYIHWVAHCDWLCHYNYNNTLWRCHKIASIRVFSAYMCLLWAGNSSNKNNDILRTLLNFPMYLLHI